MKDFYAQQFQAFVDHIPLPVFIVAEDTTLLMANNAMYRLLGKPAEELISRKLSMVMPEAEALRFSHQDALVRNTLSLQVFNDHIAPPHGIKYFTVLKFPLRNYDGTSYNVGGITIDITQQRNAAAKVEGDNHIFDAMSSLAKIGGCELDARTLQLTCTHGMYEIFETDDSVPLTVEVIKGYLLPASQEHFQQAFDNLLQGVSLDIELEAVLSSGKRLFLHAKATPIFDDGHVVKAYGALQDITHQKTVEFQLRESEKIHRMLVEQAKDAIVIVNIDGTHRFISPSIVGITGYTPQEYYDNQHLAINILDGESARSVKAFWEYYEQHGVFLEQPRELVWIHKDGHKVYTEHTYTNTYNERGECTGFQTIMRNITQQKSVELQVLRMQRMDSLGMLAGGIAHDMNNILASLLTGLQLIESKTTETKEKERVKNLQSVVWRGANLIQQILLFSKGGTREKKKIYVSECVDETVKILKETFPKGIVLEVENSIVTASIMADKTQILQVLMNLCINARDAMQGSGTMTIRLRQVTITASMTELYVGSKVGDYCCIQISDTGVGLTDEIKQKIFEPFFTTKQSGQGTGLGVATVLAIVTNHQGFVLVDSVAGQGSTFSVYLPSYGVQEAQQTKALKQQDLPTGNGGKVLIVDDEDVMRMMLSDVLVMYGYSVVIAENGEQAVERFREHQHDIQLVIMDMMMPIMDGIDTIRHLRTIKEDVKCIAMTGFLDNERFQVLKSMNIHATLSKPFEIKELLKQVQLVLA